MPAFLDPSTLLLRIVLSSEELYTATLARLSAGVPWTAAGGTNVYGWPTAAPLHPICLSGVPKLFPLSEIIAHFRKFGDVRGYINKAMTNSGSLLLMELSTSLVASLLARSCLSTGPGWGVG